MFLIIGIIIFVVLFIVLTIKRVNLTQKLLLSLPLMIVCILIGCISIVPANNVGVAYSPFSGVSQQTLSEGWRIKGIFDEIHNISTEVQTKELKDISGQTKDAQYIKMIVDVKYKVDPSKAYEVFKQYRNLDNISTTLVSPLVQRSIESISTNYNIMEILGEKRNDLYNGIETDLKTRFAANGITFVSINFTDTDAGEAIEKAIQNEAVAKKSVETAEQERLKAEVEAQKRVVDAQANKDKAKIEAETKMIQAQAEADSNKIISQSITPGLLDKMEMEARQKFGWVTVQGGTVITDATGNSTNSQK